MKATPKVELLIDPLNPVEEVANIITYLLGMHPGRELDILQKIDQTVGDALASLQPQTSGEKGKVDGAKP